MSRSMSAAVDLTAGVEAAYALLSGPAWPQALDEQLHDGSAFVSADPVPGGGVALVTSRRLPDGIPGFLQRFTPADGRVTQTDTWGPLEAGAPSGSWAVTFPGSPGTIEGRMSLEPVTGGCRWVVSGTVRVAVPLLGGRIESFLAPLIEKLVLHQGEVLQDRLTG